MTCTRCFRKIAASTLEKSCKGEHRQQGEGEGEREFPHGAKGMCVWWWWGWGEGFAFPWVLRSLLPWPGILTRLRLTLVLAHFGGSGSLCSLCICARMWEGAHSRGLGGWALSWVWGPWSVTESKLTLLTAWQTNESERQGIEARDMTLFGNRADPEDGRLVTQSNHLVEV